jgi:Spy/CpxP family protein refolding chaperone
MKSWIQRSLIGLTAATIVLTGLTACGSRGDHARGWSDDRITEMRGKAIEKISDKLELNTDQKTKLGVLADEMITSRKAFMGNSADPRVEMRALVAAEKFDRTKAQAMLEQKTQVVQGNGPKMLSAFGDFYDSLTPAQQLQVRAKMDRRGHSWWSRG